MVYTDSSNENSRYDNRHKLDAGRVSMKSNKNLDMKILVDNASSNPQPNQ